MALKKPLSLRARVKPKALPMLAARRAPATDDQAMRPTGRWALGGAVVGGLLALLAFAPASWLTGAIENATDGRLLLAEPEGSVWRGSALPVLTGGPGSRDAAVLPSRLSWSLSPSFSGLQLLLAQDCCIAPGLRVELRPGWRKLTLRVLPVAETIGQWPAAWLEGLGAPWNTLKPGGQLRVVTRNLVLRSGEGSAEGWQLEGQAEMDLLQASSRLSTLDPLGSYRVRVTAQPAGATLLNLSTLDGALLLSGNGEFGGPGRRSGLRFRGDARAAPGFEPALNNLLNIIGRRNGALSVISIG